MGGCVRPLKMQKFCRNVLILFVPALVVWTFGNFGTSAGATEFHYEQRFELQRSMAQYQRLLNQRTMRGFLQVEESKQTETQQSLERVENAQADPEIQEPEKHVDEFHTDQQQVVRHEKKTEMPEEKSTAVNEGGDHTTETLENDHQQSAEKEEEEKDDKEKRDEENVEEPFVYPEPYLLGPPVKDWDEQRARWLDLNPHFKSKSADKPRVLIVTGSQPWPCNSPVGDNFHLKSLKIKIDYARMHNYEIYYNFAWLDPLFGSYWVKLPIVRKLMLTHPEIEWFFWVDSDAVFTDLLFEAPFASYDREGTNMVMWGWHHGFFTMKNWIAINAGVFLIRNCQWSLDLFDKWSPMGPEGPVRDAYGRVLTEFLTNRDSNYPADDQSALGYLILTDENVREKVKIIDEEYKVSLWWVDVKDKYEMLIDKYHPGLGDARWPWITHFTGCSPCSGRNNPAHSYDVCMQSFERAYLFADNQVLAYLGMQHVSLQSEEVIKTRNDTDRPLEHVGVNPWADRIARVAAEASAS